MSPMRRCWPARWETASIVYSAGDRVGVMTLVADGVVQRETYEARDGQICASAVIVGGKAARV